MTLPKEQLQKLGMGAAIAMCGAFLTYMEQAIPSIDFGAMTEVIVAVNSILVNYFRKLLLK